MNEDQIKMAVSRFEEYKKLKSKFTQMEGDCSAEDGVIFLKGYCETLAEYAFGNKDIENTTAVLVGLFMGAEYIIDNLQKEALK